MLNEAFGVFGCFDASAFRLHFKCEWYPILSERVRLQLNSLGENYSLGWRVAMLFGYHLGMQLGMCLGKTSIELVELKFLNEHFSKSMNNSLV